MAATYSEMGEAEKARDQIKSLLNIIPEFTMATFKQRYWYKSEAAMNRVSEALRKAGLPEELTSAIG